MNLLDELPFYLRAPYPYLYIVSWEEAKLQRMLETVCSRLSMAFEVWNAAGELGVGDLLKRVMETSGPRVFLLLDFHIPLQNATLVRALRNLVSRLSREKATLVFCAPVQRLPIELDKDVVVLEMPLPGSDVLQRILGGVLQEQQSTLDAKVRDEMVRASKGLTEVEAYRAFSKVLLKLRTIGVDDPVGAVVDEKRQILSKSKLLEFWDRPIDLEQVGGLSELKRWLTDRRGAFGDRARQFGLPQPKGLLLVGVQGCGKSLTAKAIASLWRLPLVRFDVGNLFNREFTPEESIRQVIRLCESMSPIVLWIDEIDKAFQGGGDDDALTRVFGSMITWMQEKVHPVFVVATANNIDHLPPEMMRKGRFDEIFFVDLPDLHDRAQILEIHLRRHGREVGGFDLMELARKTDYFVGSELEQTVIAGLYRAFQRSEQLEQEDLLVAVSEIVPLYYTYEEQIKALREWAKHRARFASADTSLVDLFTK